MRFSVRNGLLKPAEIVSEGLQVAKHSLRVSRTNPSFLYSKDLQTYLQGRLLLPDELPFPFALIQSHVENGYVSYEYGVKDGACFRCGNKDPRLIDSFACARCSENCSYCRACIQMGRVSECTPLIKWTGPYRPKSEAAFTGLKWEGKLSNAQQKGSDRMVHAVRNQQDLLLWAVCGAGKTEMLFQGITEALSENKQVCLAAPRTDVILELTPRLRTVFPNVKIASLYGGSEERFQEADLVIATTHQLMRFTAAFDVLIIDEVDAFPFSADEKLQFAAARARKPDSSLIYLTATPSEKIKEAISLHVQIPQRYHGHPLPVPSFTWCGHYKRALQKKRLPEPLQQWVTDRLCLNKQAFLFVPSISILKDTVAILKEQNAAIEGVYAEDPDRKEKVQKFRDGAIPIIVTTTILERGVTIPNSDAAVLGAEADIFTESALVQIAGRVGRSAAHPDGDVRFFHYGKTEAMIRAKKHIQMMNSEAAKVTF